MTDEETKHFKTLCKILISLDTFSKDAWKKIIENPTDENKLTIENIKFLNIPRYPLQSKRLKELAHGKTDQKYIFLNTPWFYLPPLRGDDLQFIPILYLDFDLRNSPPIISYRISLLKIYDSNMTINPKGFGYRFEMGHECSSHEYCHAQITIDTMGIGQPLPSLPPWLPEQTPCFPMPARCPISLFLCLIICLYGKQLAREIISEVDVAKEYLEPVKNIIVV